MAALNQLSAFKAAPAFLLAASGINLMDTAAAYSMGVASTYGAATTRSPDHSLKAVETSVFSSDVLVSTSAELLTFHTNVEEQLTTLRELPTGWDGYNASRISPRLIKQMLTELCSRVSDDRLPVPDLIPGGDGSIQAEWHEVAIELSYRLDASGHPQLWAHDRQSGKELEVEGVDAVSALDKWLPKLVSKA